ncbi:hypothetical protein HK405_011299 [Cladochytrium tenue]|nr:hypothetical protein HK405_011299 [Cladochytrium tenue]
MDKLLFALLLCAYILRSRAELDPQETDLNPLEWWLFSEAPDPWEAPPPPRLQPPAEFQRLLLVRVLRAEKMVPAMQEFVEAKLGSEPPTFDLASNFEKQSTSRTPLVRVVLAG